MRLLLILIVFLYTFSAFAWNGYDSENSANVEIGYNNLVRPGETIEVYDSDRGYIDVDVENVNSYGGSTEVEVYDSDTGEYRIFEMDEE